MAALKMALDASTRGEFPGDCFLLQKETGFPWKQDGRGGSEGPWKVEGLEGLLGFGHN